MPRRVPAIWLVAVVVCSTASAQTVSQRGFVEGSGWLYPQEAPNDQTRVVGDLLAREELFVKAAPWIQFAGGLDVRANTHDQVEDTWRIDFSDRGIRRPRLSIRRLSATIAHGPFTLEVGKQFIRWGRTDVITPTDRFAPRDFLNVVDSEFLAVTGARGTIAFGSESVEVAWVPRLTPSRIPLLDQRWTVVPAGAAGVALADGGSVFPSASETGVRWRHTGSTAEYALSFFDGANHLPDIDARLSFAPAVTGAPPLPAIVVTRVYPSIRSYGADAAVPTRWVTIKGEAAYITSPSQTSDDYVLYVVELERQTGEWMFVGGYAGDAVAAQRVALTFSPDRGLARSFVGRASYTIDPNRSVVFEGAVHQDGYGAYLKTEYSQAHGDHWRATITGGLIRGRPDDFLGQFRRNSHVIAALRYSF